MCGSAPNRLVLVQLASDPPDGRSRSPLPWRGCTRTRLLRDHHLRGSSGQLENCEQRGPRARRLAAPGHRAPSVARRVLDDETAKTPASRTGSSLVRWTLIHERRVGQEPPSRGRVSIPKDGTTVNPGSISPGHLGSPFGGSCRRNPNTKPVPRGRRPSRSAERRILSDRAFDGLGIASREGRDPGDDRGAFRPSR